jgi:hypothetical protein
MTVYYREEHNYLPFRFLRNFYSSDAKAPLRPPLLPALSAEGTI